MRSMMSLVALTAAASIGGTALAADTTGGKTTDEEAPVIEMKVEEGAVPEDLQMEDKTREGDEDAVEMKVEQEDAKPRETWMTGETPATSEQD